MSTADGHATLEDTVEYDTDKADEHYVAYGEVVEELGSWVCVQARDGSTFWAAPSKCCRSHPAARARSGRVVQRPHGQQIQRPGDTEERTEMNGKAEDTPISHTAMEITVRCPQCQSQTTDVVRLSGKPGERAIVVAEVPCSGCTATVAVPIDTVLK